MTQRRIHDLMKGVVHLVAAYPESAFQHNLNQSPTTDYFLEDRLPGIKKQCEKFYLYLINTK